MATSLVSTGVQFPDNSVQTTAITANPATTNVRQAVTSASTTTLNFASGTTVDLTMAAHCTLSFSGAATSGTAMLVNIVVRNASTGVPYYLTWPSSVYWDSNDSALSVYSITAGPPLASGPNGVTVISLLTTDGGTKWRGWVDATIPGLSGGYMWGWGYNRNASSIGTTDFRSNQASPMIAAGGGGNWTFIHNASYGASNTTHAIDSAGQLWAINSISALGYAPTLSGDASGTGLTSRKQWYPVSTSGGAAKWKKISSGLSATSDHVVGLQTDGTLWNWGTNQAGQLATNLIDNRGQAFTIVAVPFQPIPGTKWIDVAATSQGSTLGIKSDGSLWSWGHYVATGQNVFTNSSSPVQVGSLTNWAKLSYNNSATSTSSGNCGAIKTDGTLWTWGNNGYGQLGDSTGGSRVSPVQVGSLTNWKYVSFGHFHCVAVKTDGTLWTWGNNSHGQLGQNNATSYRNSPIQVGSDTNWAAAVGGQRTTMAVRTDGTLWGWGKVNECGIPYNSFATPSGNNASSPKQIGSRTDWVPRMGAMATGLRLGFALQTATASLNPS